MIVAMGHQKEVGKDTLIKYCIDHLRQKKGGLKIVRRGFADKLYQVCHLLYGWAGFRERQYYVNHPPGKNDMLANGYTARELLIKLGNHMRAFDAEVWIDSCLRDKNFDVLFVSDLRYPNEFKIVKELNGEVIRITRPGLVVPTDEADTALNGWEDQWDFHISNDGDHNNLHREAGLIVDRILAKL